MSRETKKINGIWWVNRESGGGGDDPAVLAAINDAIGYPGGYPTSQEAVQHLQTPAVLEVGAVTVETGPGTTENVAYNENVKIKGSDGVKYTLPEWNALYVAAGYDKDAMTVQPIGLSVDAYGADGEVMLFDRFDGRTWNVTAENQGSTEQLALFVYNQPMYTAAASGTDIATGKGWAVVDDGDAFLYRESNTGSEWRVPKAYKFYNQHEATKDDIAAITDGMWAVTEWCRRRFAIDSGLTTTDADGTVAAVEILNASGAQAAVGEDFYFWIGGANTGILAKYNVNNLSGTNSYLLTQAIADAIYAKQKANGVNMNDTGVNSDTKPVLAEGSKGAEAIAVGGKWYIATPYISNANATTNNINNNIADSPAVYWAKLKGCALPTNRHLNAVYLNKLVVDAVWNYLRTTEGWPILARPNGSIWTAVRQSAYNGWYVGMPSGNLSNVNTSFRNYAVGASAS